MMWRVEEALSLLIKVGFTARQAYECRRSVAINLQDADIFQERFLCLGGSREQ